MSEFLDVISHAKKLNRALKALSIDDIEALAIKLDNILANRKKLAAEEMALAAEKSKKIEQLQKMMLECNISPQELTAVSDNAPKKKRQPRPAKYAITIDGEKITWTGQGRMPNVFKNAAKPLESYAIK